MDIDFKVIFGHLTHNSHGKLFQIFIPFLEKDFKFVCLTLSV